MNAIWPEAAHPVTLSIDEVHVYRVPLGAAQADWAGLWATLSADEQHRAGQYRIDAPRRRFVLARAALRTLLGRYSGMPVEAIRLVQSAQGKPQWDGEQAELGLRFNVSHSDELAIVAVTMGCEVGVDVERLRTVGHAEQIARRYFHFSERTAILAAPPAARDGAFLRCWTGKEAVLKAAGSGIAGSLAGFCVPIDSYNPLWIELPTTPALQSSRCWLQPIVACEEYIGAVACLDAKRRLRCFTLNI